MAIINIAGVSSHNKSYTAHIVLTKDADPGDPTVVVVLGEAFVEIPQGIEKEDVKALIVDASQSIFDKHRDALNRRHDLDELEFPPIT
ncbi:hypothetical protein ES703_56201 [subsurface metagenome]